MYNRDYFTIHGGLVPGSEGCIDLVDKMWYFAEKFTAYGRNMRLKVCYAQYKDKCKENQQIGYMLRWFKNKILIAPLGQACLVLYPFFMLASLHEVYNVLNAPEGYGWLFGSDAGGWLYHTRLRYLVISSVEVVWCACGILLSLGIIKSFRRSWLLRAHLAIFVCWLLVIIHRAYNLQ